MFSGPGCDRDRLPGADLGTGHISLPHTAATRGLTSKELSVRTVALNYVTSCFYHGSPTSLRSTPNDSFNLLSDRAYIRSLRLHRADRVDAFCADRMSR